MDFKTKIKVKEKHFIIKIGSIHQEDIIIINKHTPNNSKEHEAKASKIKEKIDS